ncbi:hypothetical protein SAMN05216553_101600 [Lentzea fradiae]|uniref:Secreted protein n=1 Tax=Lentzea fradiae TaxID=200378 RepID=A0A1G7L0W9_9PSEU|nr:hypothetical protein [Lentzea fradiae]SDF42974.1 hypothetical protein SAMN05216553_101600 [Lentzea fradiae]
MKNLLRKAGKAAVAGALALGVVAGSAVAATAAPPGSVILSTPKRNLYCTLGTSTTAGFTHGAASCYNGLWPAEAGWWIVVTCVGGSTATSGLVASSPYQWNSVSAGWCWYGVADISVREP